MQNLTIKYVLKVIVLCVLLGMVTATAYSLIDRQARPVESEQR